MESAVKLITEVAESDAALAVRALALAALVQLTGKEAFRLLLAVGGDTTEPAALQDGAIELSLRVRDIPYGPIRRHERRGDDAFGE